MITSSSITSPKFRLFRSLHKLRRIPAPDNVYQRVSLSTTGLERATIQLQIETAPFTLANCSEDGLQCDITV